MVKLNPNDDKSWTLINTTQDPFQKNFEGKYRGDHANLIQKLDQAKSYNNSESETKNLLSELNSTDVDQTTYTEFPYTPLSLFTQMTEKPVKIPEAILNSVPKIVGSKGHEVNFRKMTIFSVDNVDTYPKNDLNDRYNFVVSGKKDSPTCRYSCKDIDPKCEEKIEAGPCAR